MQKPSTLGQAGRFQGRPPAEIDPKNDLNSVPSADRFSGCRCFFTKQLFCTCALGGLFVGFSRIFMGFHGFLMDFRCFSAGFSACFKPPEMVP